MYTICAVFYFNCIYISYFLKKVLIANQSPQQQIVEGKMAKSDIVRKHIYHFCVNIGNYVVQPVFGNCDVP
jgi:hypothetical protein